MIPVLAAAVLAGLLGSVHCVGMCGAFAASCTRARGGLAAWHVGRVATYTVLGAIAGTAGHLLPGPAWLPAALATVLLVWFAAALGGLVPEPRLLPPGMIAAGARAAGSGSSAAHLLFGAVNGLLPCGLVYTALGAAVAQAEPVGGGLVMLAFGLGTLPALTAAALGLRRVLLSSLWRRRAFAALILVTGLWMIGLRAWRGGSAGHPQEHQRPPTEQAADRTED